MKLQFDAGRGTTMRLSQLGIGPEQLDAVFFTHMHNDHTDGFADMVQLRWSFQLAVDSHGRPHHEGQSSADSNKPLPRSAENFPELFSAHATALMREANHKLSRLEVC